MALSDVFKAVNERMRQLTAETHPQGFEHRLGGEAELASNDTVFPRAVWVLPKPGQVRFDASSVLQVGEKPGVRGRQLQAKAIPVTVHIWTQELEDWEEDLAIGREAGILIKYTRTLTEVMGAATRSTWRMLNAGWEEVNVVNAGFVYVLELEFYFAECDTASAYVRLKDMETEGEL